MSFSARDLKIPEGQLLGNYVFDLVNNSNRRKVKYNITTGVALEVISNPYDYLNRQAFDTGRETIRDVLTKRLNSKDFNISGNIKSKSLIDFIPMNTAFVNIIDNDHSNEPVICSPFFQSHFSLPLKPGEHVWILEEIFQEDKILYYWIGRKPGFLQSEDLNFTNVEREKSITSVINKFFAKKGTETPSDEALNNSLGFDGSSDYLTTSLESIFLQSNAYREEFTGEPVPRSVKNCSDVLIQGSNNTGIHLTTEKFEAEYEPTQFTGAVIKKDTNAKRKPDSGAIDIFVSRKKSDLESLKETTLPTAAAGSNINIAKNSILDERFQYYEIDKMADVRNRDLTIHNTEVVDSIDDAVNVAGRLYIASNSNFDSIFNSNFNSLTEKTGPASILFGKNTRVISESGTRITSNIGKSFIDLDEEGNITIKAAKGGAYISLKSNGSIAIVPGENGYLYLGSEEELAINVPLGNLKNDSNPLIEAIPIVSTFGGVIGDPTPATGNFSSKVRFR